jgi:hypothetical protein
MLEDHLVQVQNGSGDWVDLCRTTKAEWDRLVDTGGRSSTLFRPGEVVRAVDWVTRVPLGEILTIQ